ALEGDEATGNRLHAGIQVLGDVVDMGQLRLEGGKGFHKIAFQIGKNVDRQRCWCIHKSLATQTQVVANTPVGHSRYPRPPAPAVRLLLPSRSVVRDPSGPASSAPGPGVGPGDRPI